MASKRDIEFTIDPNEIRTRDELIMQLINGATKSGIHCDRKKHNNKNECRKWKQRDYDD